MAFIITKNSYNKNGVCHYADDFGNSVFCKRTPTGFVGKLRFSDKSIKAEPVYVTIPLPDLNGINIRISYPVDYDENNYQYVLEEYRNVLDHWACMCYDLEIMQKRQKMGQSIDGDLEELKKYPELCDVINSLKIL